MNKTFLPHYNFSETLLGGQSFSWDMSVDESGNQQFVGFTSERAVKLRMSGEELLWQTYPVHDDWDWLSRYLRLDVDYNQIISVIEKDQHISRAIKERPGLRILAQPFDDALVGFLCSSTKSIKGIRQCIRLMAEKFGEVVKVDGTRLHLFPRVERLAEATVEDLLECKVGFRARNIQEGALRAVGGRLEEELRGLSDQEAIERLKELRGVGNKIADCIMVYGLQRDNITPLDVWGWRVAERYYGFSKSDGYEKVNEWFSEYFEGYASWAAQFLFEGIRGGGHSVEVSG